MDSSTIILAARERGNQQGLLYAGAITPAEAFYLVSHQPDVMLVDVRTNAERDWVGMVDIPKSQHAAIEWNLYPARTRNLDFLQQLAAVASQDQPILFLCRSALRSKHAAAFATEHGFSHCFDILEGLEGDKDAAGHRKNVNGWCHAGLPWVGA